MIYRLINYPIFGEVIYLRRGDNGSSITKLVKHLIEKDLSRRITNLE